MISHTTNSYIKIGIQQKGFSLLEVLISVVVVSIGLLGVIKMQINNLKFINDSKIRSQAIQLSSDILDRMRANAERVAAGDYDVNFGVAPTSSTQCTDSMANCNPSILANYDLSSWLCQLGSFNSDSSCVYLGILGNLPGGQGSINYDTSTGTTTVGVRWFDQTQKSNYASVSVSTRL